MDSQSLPPEPKQTSPTFPGILAIILGIGAFISVLCVGLGLSGALVYQFLPALPTRAFTPTPSSFPASQTAAAEIALHETQTAAPTFTPTITLTPTITSTITPSPVVVVPKPMTPTPFALPPWLVLSTENGMWMIGAGSENLMRLVKDPLMAPVDLNQALSPAGGRVAYVTGSGTDQLQDLKLRIVHIPDGEVEDEIPLIPENTPEIEPGHPAFEGLSHITNQNSLAWSPNGQYLAFTALRDQTNAGLYLYSLKDRAIQRLTDDTGQEYEPRWSPDSRYVLYNANESGLSVWSIQVGEQARQKLFDSRGQSEIFVGWTAEDSALMYSWSKDCAAFDLRNVKVDTAKQTTLFQGCFTSAALDPNSGNIAFIIAQEQVDQCPCGPAERHPGLYLLRGGMGEPRLLKIIPDAVDVRWQPDAEQFFVRTAEAWSIAYTADGAWIELQPAVKGLLPSISTTGANWAWARSETPSRDGVWVSSPLAKTPRRIFSEAASLPLWGPDGSTLLFFSKGQIYAAISPEFKPFILFPFNSVNTQAAWVWR